MNRKVTLAFALTILAGSLGHSKAAADEAVRLQPAQIEGIVAAAQSALNRYIFPDVGAKAISRLRERAPQYETMSDPQALQLAINEDLSDVTHDKHVRISYPMPAPDAVETGTELSERDFSLWVNNGFKSVRRLPGNVGYIDVYGFSPDSSLGATAAAAMGLIGHTDALIIDLRSSRGGSPRAAEVIESYFFEKQQQITSIFERTDDGRIVEHQQYTDASVIGPLYIDKPVYLLTSSHTFSCAEQFAYDLRNLKRVTIVGETTRGGANPGGMNWLGNGFGLFVPTGRAYSNVTKTNWEGVGIHPDVPTSAAAALPAAYTLALKGVKSKTRDGDSIDEIDEALKNIDTALQPN